MSRYLVADFQFHDKHLKAGPQGGQAAARALLKAVAELETSEVANSPHSVTVQIFISKANLGNSLIKVCIDLRCSQGSS